VKAARRGTALAPGLGSTMEVVHMNRIFLMSGLAVLLLGACGGKSDSIGVAECDAYVQKLNQCADKIGGDKGESLKRFSKRMVEAWKDSASKPAEKDMLAKTCSEAITDSKKSTPQCDW
jgi:hypothetical protein